jgi:hypothetical protein
MNGDDQGFELHPEAAQDITCIWEYIAEDSPGRQVVSAKTSWVPSVGWFPFPT